METHTHTQNIHTFTQAHTQHIDTHTYTERERGEKKI